MQRPTFDVVFLRSGAPGGTPAAHLARIGAGVARVAMRRSEGHGAGASA